MKNIENAPLLVKSALWGINSKFSAMTYMILCAILALVLIIFASPIYGIFFVAAAVWYAYAIRWIDKNASWTPSIDSVISRQND
jgi:hypothetical protein